MVQPPKRDSVAALRHYERGLSRLHAGDEPGARQAFLDALARDASLAPAYYQLGNSLRRGGQLVQAEQALQAAIRQDASFSEAYISLAYLYRHQGKPDAAVDMLLALHKAQPDNHTLHSQIAGLLTDMGRHAQAAVLYEACVRHQPQDAQTYLRLAQSYQKLGRFPEAEQAFLTAIEHNPDCDAAYLLLAQTRRLEPQNTGLISRFEAARQIPSLSRETRKCLDFGLGKLYDDVGAYDRAFEHFQVANRLQHEQIPFDRQALADYIKASTSVFSRSLFDRQLPVSETQPTPVFVVGMLRSGTTLVERILGSHPQVYGVGETELVDQLAQKLSENLDQPYPGCLEKLDTAVAQKLVAEYRMQWPVEAEGKRCIVDKNPLNFLHLGLITLLFPGAHVIHCVRDPLDTCLSVYCQYFAHARNSYAYDLEDIAFFYNHYTQLMEHWHTVLPTAPYTVDYETLVTEPEKTIRGLIAGLGLTWHPDCLESHKHPASIATASLWQARQPIYRDSIGRWRHYAHHLEPLRKALAR